MDAEFSAELGSRLQNSWKKMSSMDKFSINLPMSNNKLNIGLLLTPSKFQEKSLRTMKFSKILLLTLTQNKVFLIQYLPFLPTTLELAALKLQNAETCAIHANDHHHRIS
jgi:hypothetical protein